ncbi:hypothetical protein LguiB_003143 [Lonicera macranthoides]
MRNVEDELNNFIKVWVTAASSLCYCYFISSKIPKGIYRLLSLLPILSLFTFLPFSLSYVFTVSFTTILLSWLANFKLLLFSFHMGPLSTDPIKGGPVLNSLLLFLTVASFPVKINRQRKFSSKPKKFPLSVFSKTVLLSVLLSLLYNHRDFLDPKILVVAYFWSLFLSVETSLGWIIETVGLVWGLDLVPPSNKPYLATSLQDFWGRRWNLHVTNLLRDTVYNPMRWGTAGVLGDEGAKAMAVLVTFLVSGLLHEVMLYNLANQSPSWEMTWHFVVHGMGLVGELWVKKVVGDTWRLPRWMSTGLTMGFVMVVGYWFLLPSLVKTGVDVMILEQFRLTSDIFKEKMFNWISKYGL